MTKADKAKARTALAARLVALKVSKSREWSVRVTFNRRGRGISSVILTQEDGRSHKATEAKVAAKVRAEVAEAQGKTRAGENPPLTFAEAWRIATGIANKCGLGTFGVPALSARYDTRGKRVA